MPYGPEERIKRTGLRDRPSSLLSDKSPSLLSDRPSPSRNIPSLSIVNSLDVLRNRLILEISRKKALEGINRNRDYLCKIGKRSPFMDQRCDEGKKTKQFLNDK